MSTFNVPKREEVSEKNQAIFDNLEKAVALFLTFLPLTRFQRMHWITI
jgi:hypothetical protein